MDANYDATFGAAAAPKEARVAVTSGRGAAYVSADHPDLVRAYPRAHTVPAAWAHEPADPVDHWLSSTTSTSSLESPGADVVIDLTDGVGISSPGWYADPSGDGSLLWSDGTRWFGRHTPEEPRPTVDPGWYVDPDDAEALLWWNGSSWTARTSATTRGIAVAEPEVQVDPGWYVDPNDEQFLVWWDGSAWSARDSAVWLADAALATSGGGADAVEPGWYVDPRDPAAMLWWDGTAWTARSTESAEAPAAMAMLSSAADVEAGWYVDPEDPDSLVWWDGTRWAVRRPMVDDVGSSSPRAHHDDEPTAEAGWYSDPTDPDSVVWWDGAGWGARAAAVTALGGATTTLVDDEVAHDPVPGWYEDPSSDALRWWDGTTWTGDTHPVEPPQGVVALISGGALLASTSWELASAAPDPSSTAVDVQNSTSLDAGWYADPLAAALRWWDGSAWTTDTRVVLSETPLFVTPMFSAGLGLAAGYGAATVSSSFSTVPGEIVRGPARSHAVPRPRPLHQRWWFWPLLAGCVALWYVAWSSTQSTIVPSIPSISVVPGQSSSLDTLPNQGPTGPDEPLPSLTPLPLGG